MHVSEELNLSSYLSDSLLVSCELQSSCVISGRILRIKIDIWLSECLYCKSLLFMFNLLYRDLHLPLISRWMLMRHFSVWIGLDQLI